MHRQHSPDAHKKINPNYLFALMSSSFKLWRLLSFPVLALSSRLGEMYLVESHLNLN